MQEAAGHKCFVHKVALQEVPGSRKSNIGGKLSLNHCRICAPWLHLVLLTATVAPVRSLDQMIDDIP